MSVIAILGSGIAGEEAANTARTTDPEARVLIVTEEPQPLYSACVLADYVAGEIPRQRVLLRSLEDYNKAGIELLLSKKVLGWSPDQRILYLKDQDLSYDRLVLATGSRPFVPPLQGVEKEGVLPLKTLKDADLLRQARGKSAVVVGTGPVGIEAAIALKRKGWEVVMVELLDRILPRIFDAPLACSLKSRLEVEGIQVLLTERVIEMLGGNGVEAVRTDLRTIPAELVLLVIGMKPEVELAKKGGLNLGPSGGIEVDESLSTSFQGVWACGDCVESRDRITGKKGLFMLWNNARMQGKVAGGNAAGANHHYHGSLNVTTVSIFHETAASLGVLASDLQEGESKSIHRKGPWGELWLVLQDDRLVGVQAIGKTERVGGLLGLLLKGGDLKGLTGKIAHMGKGDLWALRGVQRDLIRLISA